MAFVVVMLFLELNGIDRKGRNQDNFHIIAKLLKKKSIFLHFCMRKWEQKESLKTDGLSSKLDHLSCNLSLKKGSFNYLTLKLILIKYHSNTWLAEVW